MPNLPHADVVGSLIRPAELLVAREDVAAGRITASEFKRIEDAAVDGAVAAQEEAGLEVLTDGEMRRLSFQSQMPEAVEGFGEFDIDAFLWGDWQGDEQVGDFHKERPATLGVVSPLRRKRHLSAEEFTYVRSRTTRVAKVTLPSPSLFANFWSPARSAEAYPTLEAFLADVARIVRDEIEEAGQTRRDLHPARRPALSIGAGPGVGGPSMRPKAGPRKTGSPRASNWTTP